MISSGIPNSGERKVEGGFSNYSLIYESENGYSALYKAQRGGKWFALKAAKKEIGEQARYESILRREYDLHKDVTNIYCAECYELITDPEVGLCIVMQYVDGVTLDKWLASRPSNKEKNRVLNELLEAIEELHLKQIIHQDIKPSNILITNNGHHVKLIDYGLSDNDAYILQQRGCTNGYAAPELRNGEGKATFASDIWALGCIIEELFPERFRYIVAKCHNKIPEKRFKSVGNIKKSISRTNTIRMILGIVISAAIICSLITYLLIPKPSEKELEYKEYLAMVHEKYDSCYNQCMSLLKAQEYKEFCTLTMTDFAYKTDSIRALYQPDDSIQRINFNNDYLEYHQRVYMTLTDQANGKVSIFDNSLPEHKRDSLQKEWSAEVEKNRH